MEKRFKHEARVLSKEEVMSNRCSKYKFIDFDNLETLEVENKMERKKAKFWGRLIISPFVFLFYNFFVWAGLIFPTTLIIGISGIQFLTAIGVGILNLVLTTKIRTEDTFFDYFNNVYLDSLLGLTVLIWSPFYLTYRFLWFEEFFDGN